jgi:hypothetical protein
MVATRDIKDKLPNSGTAANAHTLITSPIMLSAGCNANQDDALVALYSMDLCALHLNTYSWSCDGLVVVDMWVRRTSAVGPNLAPDLAMNRASLDLVLTPAAATD